MTTDVPAQQVSRHILASEVCARTGVTYRQLDYWLRAGLIPGDERHGSGVPRQFTEADVDYIAVFAKLVEAGLDHKRAAEAVAQINEHGTVRLSPHVVLIFEDAVDVRA